MTVERYGMVIKLKEETSAKYKSLHADDSPGVRDLLQKYNIHNFSIFCRRLEDGTQYLFGYYEYTGKDHDEDQRLLKLEPRNQEWLSVCDPLQIPLPGEDGWAMMDKVYYND